MPYPKQKTEQYANLGGINQKASIYKTGENEVLALSNYDFSEPGAWTKRWGFTNTLVSGNTLTSGASNTLNDLWQIFKDGIYGTGSTYLDPKLTFLFGHGAGVYKTTGNVGAASSTFIYQNLITGYTNANWNHVNYKDQTYFAANGQAYKYRPFTFPVPGFSDDASYFGMASPPQLGNPGLTMGTTAAGVTNFSGTYVYQYAYEDQFGYIGPRGATYVVSTAGVQAFVLSGFTTAASASYGYSNSVLFRNRVTGFAPSDMIKIAEFSGQTYTDNNTPNVPPEFLEPVVDLAESLGGLIDAGNPFAIATRFFEVYQNRLFTNCVPSYPASGIPSAARGSDYKLYFSEIDDLQTIYPESFLTIVDNTFAISALKTYNQSLIIFCEKGFFRLTGDNPDNFNVQNITSEYGCISNKATVVFKNRLWFLDETGIVEFDGANYDQVSERMFDTFASINLDAARQNACAMHVPERNEVWFAIPTGANTINNLVVVYDYLANGWTTFSADKLKPTGMAPLYRNVGFESSTLSARIPLNKVYTFGSIGASLYNFHPSLSMDDGAGITLSWQTRWHESFGKSSTNQFRRFFLDTKISTVGSTQVFNQTFALTFYANYASTAISLTRAFNTSTLTENWIDFGIPAKSMSVVGAYGSTSGDVKVYGYTVESRYQRNK